MDKLKIVERLIRDGAITLEEGLKLIETEKEYVPVDTVNIPFVQIPFDHTDRDWQVTYGTYLTNDLILKTKPSTC